MTKFTAIILWPYVFVLDFFIFLTGAQSFKSARAVSRGYFKNIMARDKRHRSMYKVVVKGGHIT